MIIFSSRDHQVVETTANRIMEIVNGQLIDKITTYDEYLESDEMARKRFTYTITESEENDGLQCMLHLGQNGDLVDEPQVDLCNVVDLFITDSLTDCFSDDIDTLVIHDLQTL